MADYKVNLHRPYVSDEAVARAVEVLRSGWIGEGPVVKELEQTIGEKFGYRNVLAMNSGTSALQMALLLAGVKQGDDVLTSAQTCTVTSHCIVAAGARPVYADIQYETGNIDHSDIARRLTVRTRAILCIHWGGLPCDMSELQVIASEMGIALIQDGAHALGARYRGLPIDHWADYTMISLQAIKTVTSVDGGLFCCRDGNKWEEAKRRRWFGIDRDKRVACEDDGYWDWDITELGFKYHMNDVCAAVAMGNLEHYDMLAKQRADFCQAYRQAFRNRDGIHLLADPTDRQSGNWLFTMHVEDRPAFVRAMASRGIETGVVHRRNDIYSLFGGRRRDLPKLDAWERTAICLPLHNMMTDAQLQLVIDAVRKGW